MPEYGYIAIGPACQELNRLRVISDLDLCIVPPECYTLVKSLLRCESSVADGQTREEPLYGNLNGDGGLRSGECDSGDLAWPGMDARLDTYLVDDVC